MTNKNKTITVRAMINAPLEFAWNLWTTPLDICRWNNASADWHTPRAQNDLRTGGRFNYRMEARDGSSGFDFSGVYDQVIAHELIEYTIDDGRKVKVTFAGKEGKTEVIESFEAETSNPPEMQRNGWQAILTNFKRYTQAQWAVSGEAI
ncbi:MAG TPA: SRPBCC family protein [bacterium]|nr:SRPBCC family protein [bacterium]HPR89413.1 SRPBCC family protein [bacterium]